MERIIVSQNENKISSHMTNAANILTWLQKIADEFQQFGCGELCEDNCREVLQDPEGYIIEHIKEKIDTPVFAGFEVKKDLILEQIQLPDFAPIKKLVYEVQGWLNGQNAPDISAFEFSEGKVTIRPGYEDEVTERYTLYATGEAETALWNALKKFKNAWLELDEVKETYFGVPKPTGIQSEHPVAPIELLDIKRRFIALTEEFKRRSSAQQNA